MADLDIGAAISAVVSAFQSAGDLISDSKKKKLGWRRKASANEMREKLLHDTLHTATDQITRAYQSGSEEFGLGYQSGDGIFFATTFISMVKTNN
jgi:hypothetical protein